MVHLAGKEFFADDPEAQNPTYRLITTHITPNTASFFDTVVRRTQEVLPTVLADRCTPDGTKVGVINEVPEFFLHLLLRCAVMPCFMGPEFSDNLEFIDCITHVSLPLLPIPSVTGIILLDS